MRPWIALRTLGCAIALSVCSARSADADQTSDPPDKLECIEAHRQAQLDERDGKLLAGRRSWERCAHEACPRLVQTACATGLREIASKVPSIVITVRQQDGSSLPEAVVTLDGQRVEAAARSRPIDVDAGAHVVTAVLPDGRRAERRFTLAPGERQVAVIAELEPLPRAEPAPAALERPVPPIVYVLGGVAVAGVATFVGFGLAGKSTQSCEPSCTDSEIDSLRRQFLIADIGLAVAVLAGGAGAYFYLSRPEPARSERAFVRVSPLAGGAGLSIGAEL